MISLGGTDISGLFSELDAVGDTKIILKRVLRKDLARDFFVVSLSALFGNLTGKQQTALIDALRGGYYAMPRRLPVKSLAEARSMPRSTFEEHLHKGESKLMRAIEPYFQLYLAG